MPRSRVMSFMTQWGGGAQRSATPDPQPPSSKHSASTSAAVDHPAPPARKPTLDTSGADYPSKVDSSVTTSAVSPRPASRARADSRSVRPMSMLQTYNPPQVDVANDTPPELQPIFSFLNSHSNKLYQEGYFLKLHDLDSRGRPSSDRVWTECFAQLVGTVLSLWDAAALDVAGEDGEVVPTFINLSDASIKMIESLPMNGAAGGSLQNVLSLSTAANNRYLLHFNSISSLTQWTAGIRLAMFEHATLQEAYTGSLIAGKGRALNSIKGIMERSKFAHDDWARVRFGAGTPWRRCWCVISPPDEKEFNKSQKAAKKSTYERVQMPKGDIKFYDTRKVTKKTKPIATITDAYAAYAIYPQSKPLIDQSTLVKLEGLVTIHGSPELTTEGFVFVMPEVHAAVSGFEMMLQWLFPAFDTFGLYGRPNKLVADSLDQRGLMFAMPKDRRWGYLDTLDVAGLIHAKGSQAWSERQWRRELKKLTGERMMSRMDGSPPSSRHPSQRRRTISRTSLPATRAGVRFGDSEVTHSSPGSRSGSPLPAYGADDRVPGPPRRTDSAPPDAMHQASPHKRSVSDAPGYRKPSHLSSEPTRPDDDDYPPEPPRHGGPIGVAVGGRPPPQGRLERIQSEAEVPTISSAHDDAQTQTVAPLPHLSPPQPVTSPPAFAHQPNSRPSHEPYQAPELRRAHSNVDAATLYQMQDAMRQDRTPDEEVWNGEVQQRQQNTVASHLYGNVGVAADRSQGLLNHEQRGQQHRPSRDFDTPAGGDRGQATISNTRTMLQSTPSTHSISRKPVPKQHTPEPRPSTPTAQGLELSPSATHSTSPSSPKTTASWEGGFVDEDALDRFLNNDANSDRQNTMQTTVSTEPDYASTIASEKPKKSIERPRAGKLKTVGNPDVPAIDPQTTSTSKFDTWKADQTIQTADMPEVDFGPTFAYKPSSRPGTSGTMTPGNMEEKRRSKSADRLRNRSRDRLSGVFGAATQHSPNEANRASYFGGRNTPSPGIGNEYWATPGERSSIPWRPAASTGGIPGNSKSLTPEEWVQHRASTVHQPQHMPSRKAVPNYAHNRQSSGEQLRKHSRTPPTTRALSGDWAHAAPPGTPPSRPNSRGAGSFLDPAGHLSAREQMQVSRATGTPMLGIAQNANKQQQHGEQPGLIGAVAAREREKANTNRNSMAVQQAIVERQQQQARQEAEAHAQAQAQAQYQAQMQAAQHAQAQQIHQMQQQQQWNAMMQAQGQSSQPYGQRPGTHSQNSWYQQQSQAYGLPPGSGRYSPAAGYGTPPQEQQAPQWSMATPQQPQQPVRQAYGASYHAQQQQQQGHGGSGWAR